MISLDTPTLVDIGLGALAWLGALGTGAFYISASRWRRLAEKHADTLSVRNARITNLRSTRDFWRKQSDALEIERDALLAEKASLLNRLFAAGKLKPAELSERGKRARGIQLARRGETKAEVPMSTAA